MGMEGHTRQAWRDIRGRREGVYAGMNTLLPPTTIHSTPREVLFGAGGRCQLPATYHPPPRAASAFSIPYNRVQHQSQDDNGTRCSLSPSASIAWLSDGKVSHRSDAVCVPMTTAHRSPLCSMHCPMTSPPSRGAHLRRSSWTAACPGFLRMYQTRSRTDRREGSYASSAASSPSGVPSHAAMIFQYETNPAARVRDIALTEVLKELHHYIAGAHVNPQPPSILAPPLDTTLSK